MKVNLDVQRMGYAYSKRFTDVVTRKHMKGFLMCQGSNFSGYKFKQKSHTASEIHCQPDSTERNGCLRHVTTRNVF